MIGVDKYCYIIILFFLLLHCLIVILFNCSIVCRTDDFLGWTMRMS